MDAKELKESLSERDIKLIIKSLGEEIYYEDSDEMIMSTCLCHNGNSPNKLYYYKDSKNFYCQTHCGTLDILSIVSNVKDISLPLSINYICTLLGISDIKQGFSDDRIEVIEDWSFINSFQKNRDKLNKSNKVVCEYSKSILNIFQEIYTSDWISDGISKEVMQHYKILYSSLQQKIIIPHFNIKGELIGIRGRAMLEFDISEFGKYSPFILQGRMYNHPLGQNLYGINENKETIKRLKKVMLVESEKGCLQSATAFGIENNFTLALCGCAKVSNTQRDLLLELGVEEVIIALDRQYEVVGSEEYNEWLKHLRIKIINPLLPYFRVAVLWDTKDTLKYKQSPTDVGREVLLKLMKEKIYISN